MFLELGQPMIRFSDSLRRGERIEAIAHECMHLQLSYHLGLVVVSQRIPRHGSSERLIRQMDGVINTPGQSESFWKAHYAAQKHFGGYSSESIPAPAAYEKEILSLLQELGYQREDFVFFL